MKWASEDARRARVLHGHPWHRAMTLVEIARSRDPVFLHAVTFYGGFKSRFTVTVESATVAECNGCEINAAAGPCATVAFARPIRLALNHVLAVNEMMDPSETWRQAAEPPPALFRVSSDGSA